MSVEIILDDVMLLLTVSKSNQSTLCRTNCFVRKSNCYLKVQMCF